MPKCQEFVCEKRGFWITKQGLYNVVMVIHIVTLFPEMFEGVFSHSIIKRAQEKGAVKINLVQLRDFAVDKHGTVDDKPYGGGTGMLLMPKPIFDAVRSIKRAENSKVILTSAKGKRLTQEKVRELSKLDEIIIICGRYEGVDERVAQNLADEEISIGEYVLTGGELPAMVIADCVTRLLEGVLIKPDATTKESFSDDTVEYPQYTRPEDFEGMKVPETLLSGNHAEIEKWRQEHFEKLL